MKGSVERCLGVVCRVSLSLLLIGATAGRAVVAADQEPENPPAARQTPGSDQELDAFVAEVMRRWSIPGVAVAVVESDRLVFAKGYGVRQVGKPELVDENTTFGIGSVTKSFTAAAAAMLVDEGKLEWDAPIIDYVPTLRFSDPWITAHASIRDLASHRVGIDTFFFYIVRGGSLDDTVRAARYAAPSAPFRTFDYSNLGYATLGKSIENASGQSWDDFIAQRIFRPLGMEHSYTGELGFIDANRVAKCWLCIPPKGTPAGRDALRDPNANIAVPHALVQESGARSSAARVQPVPWRFEREVAPTGLIYSTARDLAQWMRLHLAQGEYEGRRLISPERMHDLHSAQIVESAPRAVQGFKSGGYGMGWFVGTYRGFETSQHAGGRVGYGAKIWLFPEQKLGVALLQNIDPRDAPPADLIALRVADRYLGAKHTPQEDREALERATRLRPEASGARHVECSGSTARLQPGSLRFLEGIYENEMLGRARVLRQGDGVALQFGPEGAAATLWPAAHGAFTVCFDGHEQEPMPLRFTYDRNDAATGFVMGGHSAFFPEARFVRLEDSDTGSSN